MQMSGWEEITLGKSKYKNKDQQGSVLITVAVLSLILILATGLVIDLGKAFMFKAELNKACMVAAEESIKCVDLYQAENYGKNILADDFEEVLLDFFYKNIHNKDALKIQKINYDVVEGIENPKYIKVFCTADIDCVFLKIIGINKITVNSFSNGRLRRLK